MAERGLRREGTVENEWGWAGGEEIDEGERWVLTPLGAGLLDDGFEASQEICDPGGRNLGVLTAK